MDPAQHDRILASFNAQKMMHTLGAEIIHLTPGEVTIEAPILELATQQQGYGHAALAFAIGDSSAGYAALSLMPVDNEVVTAEIKINLLAPAQGDRLIAMGRVIKPGRRLSVVSSEVYAEQAGERRMIAILQGTMVPVPR